MTCAPCTTPSEQSVNGDRLQIRLLRAAIMQRIDRDMQRVDRLMQALDLLDVADDEPSMGAAARTAGGRA